MLEAQLPIATASKVLAMLRARNAVKDELRMHGVKASHLAAKEITGSMKVGARAQQRGVKFKS